MSQRHKVLVTGSTGTVGRQIVAQLLPAGTEVRALARNPATAALPDGIDVVRGDLSDPDSLHAPLEEVDAVFLMWPFATAEGAVAVLDVVATHARRVVYLSSAAVRDHERHVEQAIQQSGLAWTFLRPHVFAANALRWAEQIRAEGAVREPYGAAAMSPVHERDVAAVAVRALIGGGHTGAIYELSGPASLTQAAQARIIGEVTGRPVQWDETPPDAARQRMLGLGWPLAAVDSILQAQANMVTRPAPVTSTVEEVTGTPARTFDTWVADHGHAFRATMNAARIHQYGDASVIRHEEVPMPAPGPGEVLIQVAATSFNPSEAALRSGLLRTVLPVALPYILGWDVSGMIVQVGSGVVGFSTADCVIGRLDAGGAAAEYVAAPAGVLAQAPATVALADAAAIPVAALTAWQALFEHAHITEGQRVLINGAGGGVGVFAVQLAKHAGATVIATASSRSAAAVRSLGAEQIVDYTATPIADALDAPVDAVINLAAITPEAAARLVSLVRQGGVLVSIATPVEPPPGAEITAAHFVARNDAKQLAAIVALIDAGELIVDVAASHSLSDLVSIHRRSEAGQTRGKIILLP